MKKTTKKEFKRFCMAVEKFCHVLSLTDWNITCHLSKLDSPNNVAQIEMRVPERSAAFLLAETHPVVDDFDPERYAAHEAAHLFLGKLDYLARKRYIGEDEIIEEQERMAMVLENIFVGILEDIK